MEYRKCFVPTCTNNSNNSPNKIFVRIREDLREKWCRDVGVEYFKVYTMYCCEDHFDPKNDLKNYYQHKLMNQEPRLKPTASLCFNAPNKSEGSTELTKLLLHDATTRKPVKRKYEDTVMPSTSSYSTIPVKIDASTQCEIKMVDKSTNYKVRKATSVVTLEVPSSQETSSAATPSLFGCTSETEESSVLEPNKKELQRRKNMLGIISDKPKMYLGLPKQYLWLIDYIVQRSLIKIDSIYLIITLLKIKQNDSIERISDQFQISRTKLSSVILTGIEVLAIPLGDLAVMGHTASGVKSALCLSLLHGFLFLIADSGTESPQDHTTMDISSRHFRAEFLQEWQGSPDAPYFDPSTPRNITGLVGHPVRLLCRVKNLQNRTVSWVRHRDIHLLTVGRYTYTSDQRFEAQHKPRSEEWALRIRSPQRRDSGQYECQISTTPPIGHAVFLNIVEPETVISSGPELFIQAGSTINLTCTVRHTPEPPSSITWTHGEQVISNVINFDSARGGISLVTEKGLKSTSRLLVQRATGSDAGVYTCGPNNAPSAATRVHVLSGEHPAAMQQGCAKSTLDKTASILCCLITLYVLRKPSFSNLQFGT